MNTGEYTIEPNPQQIWFGDTLKVMAGANVLTSVKVTRTGEEFTVDDDLPLWLFLADSEYRVTK